MSNRRAPVSSFYAPLRGLGVATFGLLLALALISCGGSSSETPPPLEPSPSNVRYDRSATTLPGEIGTPTHAAPPPSANPMAPAPKRLRPPSSSQY